MRQVDKKITVWLNSGSQDREFYYPSSWGVEKTVFWVHSKDEEGNTLFVYIPLDNIEEIQVPKEDREDEEDPYDLPF